MKLRYATIITVLALLTGCGLMGGREVRSDGNDVVVDTGQLEIRFARNGSYSTSYMIFGGGKMAHLQNSFSDVTYAGLEAGRAARIYRRHPDFDRCSSAGAAEAQGQVETLNVLSADPSVSRRLMEVLDVHEKSLRNGGRRTCVTIRGSDVTIANVRAKEPGVDITGDVSPQFRGSRFLVADYAEIVDCRPLLEGHYS